MSSPSRPIAGTPEFVAWRRAEMAKLPGPKGLDVRSTVPVGHAKGVATSTSITSNYRQTHRSDSMDVQPGQVAKVFIDAEIEPWVLMGLHGYVGYMGDPRATQDVDVMVSYDVKDKARIAIEKRWPKLEARELEMVIRFHDPGEMDRQGITKPVLDLMLPWSPFQEMILADHIIVDDETGHHLPTLEAALASKYAAMVPSYRAVIRKSQDAVDFRSLVQCNGANIDIERLRVLANAVWDGGGNEIESFLEMVDRDEPFEL